MITKPVAICPVYGNAATLPTLVARLHAAVPGCRVRLVVDASPDDSAAVAAGLDCAVTVLDTNVGQHRALARGLADEPDADAWVLLDADLQDPPEAVPLLLAGLGPHAAVFAGRRGAYESRGRLLTGGLHRRVVTALTGLPPDAGAFVAVDARGRDAVLAAVHTGSAPSVVAALGAARLPVTSVPVARATRPVGESAWTARARLAQSARTLAWLARHR
ncbi:MAG: glycosyltransferase [Mycobacteriales bacterium]|nr:glycosyltransferase [Mycobacteriales bacterium]